MGFAAQPYRTATGVGTWADVMVTVVPSMVAVPAYQTPSTPAMAKPLKVAPGTAGRIAHVGLDAYKHAAGGLAKMRDIGAALHLTGREQGGRWPAFARHRPRPAQPLFAANQRPICPADG